MIIERRMRIRQGMKKFFILETRFVSKEKNKDDPEGRVARKPIFGRLRMRFTRRRDDIRLILDSIIILH